MDAALGTIYRAVSVTAVVLVVGAIVPAASVASPALSAKVPSTAEQGSLVRLTGRLARMHRDARLTVQRRSDSSWRTVATARIKARGFTLSVRMPTAPAVMLRLALFAGHKRISRWRIYVVVLSKSHGAVNGWAVAQSPSPPTATTEASRPDSVPDGPAPTEGELGRIALIVGSSVQVPVGGAVRSVETISSVSATSPGIEVKSEGEAVSLAASANSAPGESKLTINGTGCTLAGCGQPILLRATVEVRSLSSAAPELGQFTEPSPDRVAEANEEALDDELLITLGTPTEPGTLAEAESDAAVVAAHVTGGLEGSGVYELRWSAAQVLATREAQLEALSNVAKVNRFSLMTVEAQNTTPVAPIYDKPQWLWPYEQIDAAAGWNLSTGNDVTVGIIDEGNVFVDHPDMSSVSILNAPGWANIPEGHATHVAGLACAEANLIGVVGVAWGCPIVSARVGYGGAWFTRVLQAMEALATTSDAKVVNISLGVNEPYEKSTGFCATNAEEALLAKSEAAFRTMFRHVLGGPGRNILWTFSAGNDCVPIPASPWGANGDLPNVLNVAATNSDGGIASFSDFGPLVPIAAPGGVAVPPLDEHGPMSTWVEPCSPPAYYCAGYRSAAGTSMAAPQVAGLAADVLAAHPSFTAAQAATCIKDAAGTGGVPDPTVRDEYPPQSDYDPAPEFYYTGVTPVINVPAAIECSSGGGSSEEHGHEEDAVAPVGPTVGPLGLYIPIEAPACSTVAGGSDEIKVFADHSLYEFITANEQPLVHAWLWLYSGTLGSHEFSFECVSSTGGSETIEWTASGFIATITGSSLPLILDSATVTPGEPISTSTGTPDGPSPCPTVNGLSWRSLSLLVEERLGSPLSGETIFFPAAQTYSIEELHASRQTTISLTLPSTIQTGGRWNARLICHSNDAAPLDTLYEYASVGLNLEDRAANSASGAAGQSLAPRVRAEETAGRLPLVSSGDGTDAGPSLPLVRSSLKPLIARLLAPCGSTRPAQRFRREED